jgi:acyl phosphate:glycerol-3-phosphate acyltransferase
MIEWMYAIFAFMIAAIPFSLLIGKWRFNVDIREFGDGNPGATNVLRATKSKFWFAIALFCDISKGMIPVGFAYWGLWWQDWRIVPVAILAIAGHAFSPFLKFNGGKAIAITSGVWTATTLWEIPILLGLSLTFFLKLFKNSDWAVINMMGVMFLFLVIVRPTQPHLLAIWAGNFAILLFKHRKGLAIIPKLPFRRD